MISAVQVLSEVLLFPPRTRFLDTQGRESKQELFTRDLFDSIHVWVIFLERIKFQNSILKNL